ncbi:MAG: ribonuclease HII, partial [Oscillospiraceae bacterium]|nr:ribonuclease HII [Oscillospiraceae bacterium]
MVKEELYTYDDELRAELGTFCGVDEAGRGPLAGPVCCAAVVLRPDSRFEWLDDSKKVTALRREALFEQIRSEASAYHIELIDNETIDEINILEATMLGMKRCIEALG